MSPVSAPEANAFTLAACAEMIYLDKPFMERVEAIAARGLGVEIWDWTVKDLRSLAARRADGARIMSMTGYIEGDLTTDEGIARLLETAEQSLAAAETLECPVLNFHGTGLGEGGIPVVANARPTPGDWLRAADTCARLARLGAREAREFTLENLNTALDHPGCPFATAADALALVRAVDSSLLDEWEALGQAQAGRAGEVAGLLEGDRPGADDSTGVERAFGADADGRVALTRNLHAFRVAVRREMFRRVELMARDDVEGLARLDAASGWGEDRWDEALARYWDEYDWIGTDTSARAISLAPLDEAPDEAALAAAGISERLREALETSGRQVWLATQVMEDPDGDHDWRLTALVDLAECDRDKRAVVHLLSVGPQQG